MSVFLRHFARVGLGRRFSSTAASASKNVKNDEHPNVVHSEIPDIQLPNLTLPEYVFENFSKWPHKTALECGLTGKKFSFEEVRTKSRNFSKSLRKRLKLGKGSVLAILLPNIPEYPICILGALDADVTVTTINPLYTPDEIQKQLVDSGAKVIVTLGILSAAAQAATVKNRIPILTIKMQQGESVPEGCIDFTEFTDTAVDIDDAPLGNCRDTIFMPYSSGTTGLPKGVQLSHYNLVVNLLQLNQPQLILREETSETHQDTVPGVLPFFHIYGVTAVLLLHLYHTCRIVTLPKFTPELYVQTLVKDKPEVLYIVPPIVNFMSMHPAVKKEYLQPVRSVVSGAAPLGALDEQRLLQKAGKYIDMLQGYGLTETSPCVFMTSKIKKRQIEIFGSIGETISNTFIKVIPVEDPHGEPLGANQPGEILVKGPQVTKGYHNRPEETENAFVDGWFRTGDMGYYDNNKQFYITDRLKELIKVKGFQVAPAELEEIVRSYPDVADVAVIGVPHGSHGEVPKAFVVPKPNTILNTEKLKDYVAEKVAQYKQLRGGVQILDSIPKNPSGKILRRELKQKYAS